MQVLQLLGAHFPKQLVLLFPGDDHAGVHVGCRTLDWARRCLRSLDHLVEISEHLGIEGMLQVLGLVDVVLLLLLAVTQELQVLLSVHGAEFVLLAVLEVLDVLLVQDLVAGIHLVLVAFLFARHLVLIILSNLGLLNVGCVETCVVMSHKFTSLII